MNTMEHLMALPGTVQEEAWLRERLETLSVRESYAFAAATARHPPKSAAEAVECLHSLDDYKVYFPVGSYEELGTLYRIPEDVLPYTDLERLGKMYEDKHPGLFVGQCYVMYPKQPADPGSLEKSSLHSRMIAGKSN